MDRVVATILGIVLAIGLSAIVFIGFNKLFDQAERRFAFFNALVGGSASLVVFGLLWGNRLIVSPELVTLIATAIGIALGIGLGLVRQKWLRLGIGLAGGLALGLLAGSAIRSSVWPSIEPVAILIGLGVGAAVALISWLVAGRRVPLVTLLLFWLAIGWLFGAWLAADFNGTKAEVVLVSAILGLLAGAWAGSVPYPTGQVRAGIAAGSRKYIFLAPALLFIIATLVTPLARTIWLGFQTGTPRNLTFAGLKNYGAIFTDPGILDLSNWITIFSSRLFWAAVIFVVIGIGLGVWQGRSGGSGLGTGFSLSTGTLTLMGGGVILLGFAIFVVIRGTISNNLWWIFSVTIFSVTLGLAIAVLADRAKGENIAKSLIFLPMAISFVGASIIWRFMYIARPPQNDQTGVMNSLWVRLGEWSQSETASFVIVVILGLISVGLAYLAFRGRQAGNNAIVSGSIAVIIPLIWLIFRFLGPGIGGVTDNPVTGEPFPDPVLFLTNTPWNNWWMMIVFIWIQTGFAMIIFSAAIKSVPEDLLEAARIDGATESQAFWRITIPQIGPTIGVVATTLIVTVLKVFDIPKVMTNGNFDTQVLANEMWQRAFTELNFGLGSALAVVLFLGVLPIMYLNIRRMQRERLG
jgi:alpha-glucoside transport system permease protein